MALISERIYRAPFRSTQSLLDLKDEFERIKPLNGGRKCYIRPGSNQRLEFVIIVATVKGAYQNPTYD